MNLRARRRPRELARAGAAVLVGALLLGCSADAGGSAGPTPSPTATAGATPTPTPSVSPPPTPEQEFREEVEELYALVRRSVEGSGDPAASAQVLDAFATTVALVRVPPELVGERQEVVDAGQAAAEAFGDVTRITGAVERAAASRDAVVRLRELGRVVRTLPQ